VVGDATKELLWRLDHDATLAREVPRTQDGECIVGERRRHVRTVRSRARARNRPRTALAWILVVLLSGLIGLCAMAARASADADLDEAGDSPSLDEHAVESRSSADVEAVLAEESMAAASGLIDTTSIQDAQARHSRPSRWGRLDLAVAWRLNERIDGVGAQAVSDRNTVTSEPRRRGELWLLLTWRN
jgi:hypothetical protein